MLNFKSRQPCSRKRLTHAQNIKSGQICNLAFLTTHLIFSVLVLHKQKERQFRSMVLMAKFLHFGTFSKSFGHHKLILPKKQNFAEFWLHVAKKRKCKGNKNFCTDNIQNLYFGQYYAKYGHTSKEIRKSATLPKLMIKNKNFVHKTLFFS